MPIEMMIRKLRQHSERPNDDMEALRSIVTSVKNLPEDTPIIHDGQLSTQCCVILSGFAYRSKVSEDGKRQILSFHIAGDIPDLHSLPLKRMDHDLTTLSTAQLGFIDHDALEGTVSTRPALARALWRESLVDAALFRQWIVNLGTRSASGRMAYLIAELRQRLGAMDMVANEQFDFPVTQSKLADALGLSVVHVNRVLQAFRTQGTLDLRRRTGTLGDLEKIVQLGGFDSLEDYIGAAK
ncbi:Crp/Fnr family transcriptional regulator [Bradyrhizobium sp. AUGA SZCCT0124]|uniref:Crp/Fnr family transcriptional regulator n=1 Tax=unclassified Bradyrhizobium TaxID=2631580 RepID=UPI001BADEF76|nr:Crp/Fnr family transcriptional regulator [Bradyrhizobium sp. AUGA SZCCT0124]MBR1317050.1 Crp/Fnr family transcriptional regulator [Bradyrhizobium sp. AUGA SZCCT0051]MBR1345216.1 Crp/Fnr family transcriptional regulator [Bradyrhizobium sp. AUGA SZCCT0105]MBR1360293.1 Crp/Fnr family transcriptional regulator [Bradyrhizobium sp. AUGA SZCCT0045]